jgi:hypothetical protein
MGLIYCSGFILGLSDVMIWCDEIATYQPYKLQKEEISRHVLGDSAISRLCPTGSYRTGAGIRIRFSVWKTQTPVQRKLP